MSLKVNQSQNNSWTYSLLCLHFDTRSNRFLINLSFFLKLNIASCSKRQKLRDFDTILYSDHFLKMDHLISKSLFWSFKLRIYILFLQFPVLSFVSLQIICYLFVMITGYICHIIHAAITNFNIITIEDLVTFMISIKVFIQ